MATALAVVRTFPREIRSDLSHYHHRNIGEWWQGAMTSAELLDLVEFLPDESSYQTARRGGDWSTEQYLKARLIKEVAYSRGAEIDGLESPLEQYQIVEKQDWLKTRHAENLAQMRRKKVS